jgi:hypothetical protein
VVGFSSPVYPLLSGNWRTLPRPFSMPVLVDGDRIGIRAKPPERWECTGALSFALFES